MVGLWRVDVFTIHADGSEQTWLTDQRAETRFERDRTWLRTDLIYPTQPLETQLNYLTFDLAERRWVSISFSNTGYRDIQFSNDNWSDQRLAFEGYTCDLNIAPDGCRDVVGRITDDEYVIVSERKVGEDWVPFSRARYTRIVPS